MSTAYAQGCADAQATITTYIGALRSAARANAGPGVDQWSGGYIEALDDLTAYMQDLDL